MSDNCQFSDRTKPQADSKICSASETMLSEVRESKNLSNRSSNSGESAAKVLAPLEIVDSSVPTQHNRDDNEARHGGSENRKGTKAGEKPWSPVVIEQTKDGGTVTQDAQGNKQTTWRDGSVRIENKDGSGYAHKGNEDGSYTEFHWGKNKQDNYVLRKLPDGKYEVSDVGLINFKPANDGDFRVEMAKLKELADKKISDPADRARFEADMNKFASRQQELKERFLKQGLSQDDAQKKAADETSKTYQQIEKLLSAHDNPNLKMFKEKDRVALAEQIMHQAATPSDVSQGNYNTCNVTVIEVQAYTKCPSEAARMVTDMALTGKYVSNGTPPFTVQVGKDINADSLKKHGDAKGSFEPGENKRSHASQIFEVTAVNLHYAKENAKTNPPGQIRYEQHESKGSDNGERLLDYSKKDSKTGKAPAEVMAGDEPVRSPDLSPQEIAALAKDIVKGNNGPVRLDIDPVAASRQSLSEAESKLLAISLKIQDIGDNKPVNFDDPNEVRNIKEAVARKEMPQDRRDEINKLINKLEREHAYVDKDGIAFVRDEKQLAIALAKLSEEGRLPIIVGVYTGTEPFNTDANNAGARGGKHVINVTGFKPGSPPTVSIDNQWQVQADHANLPVSKLFESMHHREASFRIQELEKKVEANRKSGNIDFTKETELLFEKFHDDKIDEKRLIDGTAKIYQEAGLAKKQGKLNEEQELALLARLRELRDQLPKEQQATLIAKLKEIKAAREAKH